MLRLIVYISNVALSATRVNTRRVHITFIYNVVVVTFLLCLRSETSLKETTEREYTATIFTILIYDT